MIAGFCVNVLTKVKIFGFVRKIRVNWIDEIRKRFTIDNVFYFAFVSFM